MGYLKEANDSHKIIVKALNETGVNYCVKIFNPHFHISTNIMLSRRQSWFLISDPNLLLLRMRLWAPWWRSSEESAAVISGDNEWSIRVIRLISLLLDYYRHSWHGDWRVLIIPTTTGTSRGSRLLCVITPGDSEIRRHNYKLENGVKNGHC